MTPLLQDTRWGRRLLGGTGAACLVAAVTVGFAKEKDFLSISIQARVLIVAAVVAALCRIAPRVAGFLGRSLPKLTQLERAASLRIFSVEEYAKDARIEVNNLGASEEFVASAQLLDAKPTIDHMPVGRQLNVPWARTRLASLKISRSETASLLVARRELLDPALWGLCLKEATVAGARTIGAWPFPADSSLRNKPLPAVTLRLSLKSTSSARMVVADFVIEAGESHGVRVRRRHESAAN